MPSGANLIICRGPKIYFGVSLSSKSGHEKPWLKLGGPPSKAKYILRSIVNKYREGKVKRTPGGEWNRTWNYVRTRTRSLDKANLLFIVLKGKEQRARPLGSNSFRRAMRKNRRFVSSRWRGTFCRTIQRVIVCSKRKPFGGRAVKASLNRAYWVAYDRPETRWPNHGQVEATVKRCGGPNQSMFQNAWMTCG